jgi:hypothetical protein
MINLALIFFIDKHLPYVLVSTVSRVLTSDHFVQRRLPSSWRNVNDFIVHFAIAALFGLVCQIFTGSWTTNS